MKERFCKRNVVTALLLSVVIALTVFFFSPTDVYLSCQRDFPISFSTVALPMLLTSFAAMAVLMLVLMLSLRISKKLFNVMMCVFTGIEAAFYSQMMFMNGRVEELNGASNDFSDKPTLNSINFVIFYLIIVLPLILYALRDKKLAKLKEKADIRLVGFFSCALIAVQAVGNISSAVKNGVKNIDDKQYTSYFSYDDAMELSKERNVVVFLADNLDGAWMDNLIERYPEVSDELDGFTYYRNNTPCYTGTFPSVLQMLTGCQYDGTETDVYMDTCWLNDNPMKEMKRSGYNVNLYLDSYGDFYSYEKLQENCDNIRMNSECGIGINYFKVEDSLSFDGIVPAMTKVSLAKVLPYTLKSLAFENIENNFQSRFFYLREDDIPERMAPDVSPDSDMKFNSFLSSHDIKGNSEKPVFTFIHLNGAHDVSAKLGKLYSKNSGKADAVYTARGDLQIIFNYIEKMKQAEVYDNTTIIIVADHGDKGKVTKSVHLEKVNIASLLIKEAGEKGSLKTNSDAELSNLDFTASILEYAGIDHGSYGESYNDIIKKKEHRTRSMYINNHHKALQFVIDGDARDISNWKEITDTKNDE